MVPVEATHLETRVDDQWDSGRANERMARVRVHSRPRTQKHALMTFVLQVFEQSG